MGRKMRSGASIARKLLVRVFERMEAASIPSGDVAVPRQEWRPYAHRIVLLELQTAPCSNSLEARLRLLELVKVIGRSAIWAATVFSMPDRPICLAGSPTRLVPAAPSAGREIERSRGRS
jgi:hypothetical protein